MAYVNLLTVLSSTLTKTVSHEHDTTRNDRRLAVTADAQ